MTLYVYAPDFLTSSHCTVFMLFYSSQGRTGNPEDLRTAFNVPEKQYHHACLLALCQDQAWREVEELLTSKGLFGFGKKKKSPVGFERVVKLLAGEKARDWQRTPGRKEYKAPDHVSA